MQFFFTAALASMATASVITRQDKVFWGENDPMYKTCSQKLADNECVKTLFWVAGSQESIKRGCKPGYLYNSGESFQVKGRDETWPASQCEYKHTYKNNVFYRISPDKSTPVCLCVNEFANAENPPPPRQPQIGEKKFWAEEEENKLYNTCNANTNYHPCVKTLFYQAGSENAIREKCRAGGEYARITQTPAHPNSYPKEIFGNEANKCLGRVRQQGGVFWYLTRSGIQPACECVNKN